jgi:hypothetical protein
MVVPSLGIGTIFQSVPSHTITIVSSTEPVLV